MTATRQEPIRQPFRQCVALSPAAETSSTVGSAPRRAFFFLLPNLADDSELDVYAFRLLAHYQRVAGLAGTCAEPTATTAVRCRMSPRRVVQARAQLVEAGWITVGYRGPAGQQVPVVSVVDRMADNIAHYERPPMPSAAEPAPPEPSDPPARAAAPARTTDRPPLHLVQAPPVPAGRSPEQPDKTPEDTGIPPLTPLAPQPNHRQQGDGIGSTETVCPSPPAPGTAAEEPARALVAAFYRGLGVALSTATLAMQRRDLAIARQLVGAGATPREAEVYARETSSLGGRLAPIDLRSFERERPGWLARQHCQERRYTDRTGLPPTWLADAPELAWTPTSLQQSGPSPGDQGVTAGGAVAATARGRSELAGEHLGHVLRDALLAGSR